jgi:hypothetical protein
MLALVVKPGMHTRTFFPVLLAALLLAPPAEAAKIKSQTDTFNGVVQFTAPWKHKLFGGSYQLRARLNPESGVATYFIYVENTFFESNRGGYSGTPQGGANPDAYRDYYTARDRDGTMYEVVPGAKSFNGCNTSFCYYEEDFAIRVPAGVLGAAAPGSLVVRALSRAKVALDLEVPGDHIRSLMTRIAEEQAKLPDSGR